MKKELKFKEIINDIIDDINNAKSKSSKIHKVGNIKSSGNEVENLVREKISLFLPDRYLVKQGHIVNSEGLVSPQLDIIIFDRLNTPKFFESSDNSVFFPIESVLAIGEIKKTLYNKDIIEFRKKIKYLKDDMKRKLIKNTAYGGKIKSDSKMSDIVNMRTDRKYKNPLFSFVFSIDVDNFDNLIFDDECNYLPNDIYILNNGFFVYADLEDKTLKTKVEDEEPNMVSWIVITEPGVKTLAMLLDQLIKHLNNCLIEPFSISHYMSNLDDFGLKGSNISTFTLKEK
ncbi:MAG: hypothetical protein HOD64_07815 [Candidatus Cloacimonetes bacterium]|jgi:hypothetical protein|nr:hypothetical protein [Candidatus Cloacimonadota bacterium]